MKQPKTTNHAPVVITGGPAPFAPGDVVTLKSGGAPMTVDAVNPEQGVLCAWCDHAGQFRVMFFNPLSLRPA